MLKLAIGILLAGWGLLGLTVLAGQLRWNNGLLWWVPALLSTACVCALSGLADREQRGPLLLVAMIAFASLLAFVLLYFFVFGLVGH